MKKKIKSNLGYMLGVICLLGVSYCIACVCLLGNVFAPFFSNNGKFCRIVYSGNQIIENSTNLYFTDETGNSFYATAESLAKIHIPYDNSFNSKGYLSFQVDVFSEENVDIRVCIFNGAEEPVKLMCKFNEGNNIVQIPLKNATEIRIDFVGVPTSVTVSEIIVSNQLVGVLPMEWYVLFFILVIIGIEIILQSFGGSIKAQKRVYDTLTRGVQLIKRKILSILIFLKKHKWAFGIIFLIIVFAYGYNLTNFSLGVDEERDIVRSVGSMENVKELLYREGRYGLYLFRMLETLDGSFTVFVEEFLSVIFIFGNIVVWAKSLDVVTEHKIRESALVAFGGMMATLPYVNAEIMCYSIMNAGVYFSIMLMSTALYLVTTATQTKRKSRLIIAVILIISGLFCSEAHNAWFLAGTVFIVLTWVIANPSVQWKQCISRVLYYAFTFIIAFAGYMVIQKVVGTNGYVGEYFHWQDDTPLNLIKNIFSWIWTMLTNEGFPGAVYLLVGLFVFCGFLVVYVLSQNVSRACMTLLLSVCLFLTPFSLCFISGSRMPYRTLEALLILEAGVWFLIINFINRKSVGHYVLLLVASCILWKQCVWMNRIFYGADLNARLDVEMGYSIGEEIEKVAGTKNVDKPVVFVGKCQHSSPSIYKIDAVGQSIFYRPKSCYKVYYLRYLGFDFMQADTNQIEKAEIYSTNMEVWPLEGAVQEFEDIIVVRLN